MCWVVYGHEYNARMKIATNLASIQDVLTSTYSLVVIAGVYAVDVFFFMSGFFFTYIFMIKLSKMRFNFLVYISTLIHRVYRILPLYALLILFMVRVMPWLGSGPIWNDFVKNFSGICHGRWYYNMMFIDNYFNTFKTGYCFGWGWYLSNDI